MNNIEVSYENINIEIDNKIIVKICNNILKLLNIDNWEISLVLCDDEFIRVLNRDYRGKDDSTDVLSFPQSEGEGIPLWDGIPNIEGNDISAEEDETVSEKENSHQINNEVASSSPDMTECYRNFYAGDIIISLETVNKNSEYFNVDKNEEFVRLLIHGILHLKGMTHESNDIDQEMLIRQEEILKEITGVDIF